MLNPYGVDTSGGTLTLVMAIMISIICLIGCFTNQLDPTASKLPPKDTSSLPSPSPPSSPESSPLGAPYLPVASPSSTAVPASASPKEDETPDDGCTLVRPPKDPNYRFNIGFIGTLIVLTFLIVTTVCEVCDSFRSSYEFRILFPLCVLMVPVILLHSSYFSVRLLAFILLQIEMACVPPPSRSRFSPSSLCGLLLNFLIQWLNAFPIVGHQWRSFSVVEGKLLIRQGPGLMAHSPPFSRVRSSICIGCRIFVVRFLLRIDVTLFLCQTLLFACLLWIFLWFLLFICFLFLFFVFVFCFLFLNCAFLFLVYLPFSISSPILCSGHSACMTLNANNAQIFKSLYPCPSGSAGAACSADITRKGQYGAAFFAGFNTVGRIIFGVISDRFTRRGWSRIWLWWFAITEIGCGMLLLAIVSHYGSEAQIAGLYIANSFIGFGYGGIGLSTFLFYLRLSLMHFGVFLSLVFFSSVSLNRFIASCDHLWPLWTSVFLSRFHFPSSVSWNSLSLWFLFPTALLELCTLFFEPRSSRPQPSLQPSCFREFIKVTFLLMAKIVMVLIVLKPHFGSSLESTSLAQFSLWYFSGWLNEEKSCAFKLKLKLLQLLSPWPNPAGFQKQIHQQQINALMLFCFNCSSTLSSSLSPFSTLPLSLLYLFP